jgi:hypothetical protein
MCVVGNNVGPEHCFADNKGREVKLSKTKTFVCFQKMKQLVELMFLILITTLVVL